MSKVNKEGRRRNKKKKNKKKMKNTNVQSCVQLSKREVSGNWLKFIKSTGWKGRLFKPEISSKQQRNVSTSEPKQPVITKVLALDCEMVGDKDDQNMLARVSIVNFNLQCVYDKYVKPTTEVKDFRTRYSGIRPVNLENAEDFEVVQSEVRNLLYSKILVGHALYSDFRVLKFEHHYKLIRDTSSYSYFQEKTGSKTPSLKKLAEMFLNEKIQRGEHNSVEDAKTCMKLYKMFRKDWEISLVKSKSNDKQNPEPEQPEPS